MKSAILSYLMKVITLVFFACCNQILAGILKRICLDSLNLNNDHNDGLFPLNKSNCCINILTSFQVLSINEWLIYIAKNKGSYLCGRKQWGL